MNSGSVLNRSLCSFCANGAHVWKLWETVLLREKHGGGHKNGSNTWQNSSFRKKKKKKQVLWSFFSDTIWTVVILYYTLVHLVISAELDYKLVTFSILHNPSHVFKVHNHRYWAWGVQKGLLLFQPDSLSGNSHIPVQQFHETEMDPPPPLPASDIAFRNKVQNEERDVEEDWRASYTHTPILYRKSQGMDKVSSNHCSLLHSFDIECE